MNFPEQYIRATEEYTTFEHFVPAPYLRRSFAVKQGGKASLLICGLGFYELYLNGSRITKGRLAPYISNPDDIVYFDRYEVELTEGENVIGVWLGNGFTNNPGGHIWDFDKARFRAAPQMALRLEYADAGEVCVLESDTQWRTAPSPITFDDYRFGEHYDARREQPGWCAPGFDDSGWQPVRLAPPPRGERRLCEAEPIDVAQEIAPVSVTKAGDGFLYDFGVNTAGVCRLKLKGTAGQCVTLAHGERLVDGVPDMMNIWFPREHWARDLPLVHKDIYTARGDGEETYVPTFTYHGFRYVLVTGITAEQATPELLTLLEMHSLLGERGGFSCSDETANKLQEMTRRSDLSNFYYFPTDCPQREKNGWTADASLSAEHVLLNLAPENSYREWLRNIVKAQTDLGALPGIVPTGGWGLDWGCGPAWDSVLIELPYQLYRYRGDKAVLKDCAASILRYLHYLTTRTDENGLLAIGLGDWCPAGRGTGDPVAPLEFTDTVVAKSLADKAAFIFDAIGMTEQAAFARALSVRFRAAVRARLIDPDTLIAAGHCQTTQAMALYYGIFEPGERQAAFDRLLAMIEDRQGHIDVGVLGARVLFHVLTAFGRSDLAFTMIVRPDYPSYGNWIECGATTLWEEHQPKGAFGNSQNHHFWGDISSWFIQALAGIRLDPHHIGKMEVEIRPSFIPQLTHAEGFHIAPAGKISSAWRREDDGGITLTVELPEGLPGRIQLENGFTFDDGRPSCPAKSGTYRIRAAKQKAGKTL